MAILRGPDVLQAEKQGAGISLEPRSSIVAGVLLAERVLMEIDKKAYEAMRKNVLTLNELNKELLDELDDLTTAAQAMGATMSDLTATLCLMARREGEHPSSPPQEKPLPRPDPSPDQ